MLPKVAFLLAAVCFAETLGEVRYGGRPGPGGPPDIPPGGVSECKAITAFHVELARRTVGLMGNDYALRWVHGVRTQVVGGIMYHFELHVSRIKPSAVNYCENCNVRAWHREWLEPDGLRIDSATCTEACCR